MNFCFLPVVARHPRFLGALFGILGCFSNSFSASAWAVGIYGKDERQEALGSPLISKNPLLAEALSSTAMLIEAKNLDETSDSLLARAIESKTLNESKNLCPGQRFGDQLSIGFCSGTLVASDIVLTAGHCVKDWIRCEDIRFVFENTLDEPTGKSKIAWPKSDVYRCSKILVARMNGFYMGGSVLGPAGLDYALVRLDRAVESRRPIEIEREPKLWHGYPIVMIGHPSGLPAKVTPGFFGEYLEPVKHFRGKTVFSANLDAFGGNSGSAILNPKTGKIEGVLVRARGSDFELKDPKDENSCKKIAVYPSGPDAECTRMDAITRELDKHLQ